MRVLVVGGTRFIGPHVVRALRERGDDVIVFHRGTSCDDGAHIHADRSRVGDLARGDFDVVIDMIAMSERDARMLVDAMRTRARRLVMISSADVYRQYGRFIRTEPGDPDRVPLTEESPLRERLFPYGEATQYEKILVEREAMKMTTTILRLPAVYGPGDEQHRLRSIDETHPQWRWTRGYVENVADAIVLGAMDDRASGRIYNVGEPDAPTEREWARLVKFARRRRAALHYDFRCDLIIDTTRMRQELGYTERISRDAAVAATIAWESNVV
ncbi:MAG TPA: NAD-dependent epimerase/dehydratase family protein [Thermoanaerobaculia bacterium]|nr:NAD-dependent epimerase/dehydratase family protein [Thermoanaerobaculia bacterium]